VANFPETDALAAAMRAPAFREVLGDADLRHRRHARGHAAVIAPECTPSTSPTTLQEFIAAIDARVS
jgi:hypothetical protein